MPIRRTCTIVLVHTPAAAMGMAAAPLDGLDYIVEIISHKDIRNIT
jgi:hypothetical protein